MTAFVCYRLHMKNNNTDSTEQPASPSCSTEQPASPSCSTEQPASPSCSTEQSASPSYSTEQPASPSCSTEQPASPSCNESTLTAPDEIVSFFPHSTCIQYLICVLVMVMFQVCHHQYKPSPYHISIILPLRRRQEGSR